MLSLLILIFLIGGAVFVYMSMNKETQKFLTQKVSILNGVGAKIKQLLKRKRIEKISDLIWNLPESFTDRSNIKKLNDLEIGKITTINVKVVKYNFPRIRNLPNKVICDDETGKIDFEHNPFSMPQGGLDALNGDPLSVLGYQYDLACNGFELVSGAIRNHQPDLMFKAFEIAGYGEHEVSSTITIPLI